MIVLHENFSYLEAIFTRMSKKSKLIWKLFIILILSFIFAHLSATALLAISALNPKENWIIYAELNEAAQSKEWKKYMKEKSQLTLF